MATYEAGIIFTCENPVCLARFDIVRGYADDGEGNNCHVVSESLRDLRNGLTWQGRHPRCPHCGGKLTGTHTLSEF
jgi:hypothetical protein